MGPAARGIGEAIARELVGRGYRVLVTDLDETQAKETAERIGAAGGAAYDVTDPAAAHTITAQAREIAPLGAWVSNAGVGFDDYAAGDETDRAAAWRARLEREGKLGAAGTLADLVMRPAGTTADHAR